MTVTLDEILKYCNFLINKTQNADAISPDEYNSILPIVNMELFELEMARVDKKFGAPFIDSYRNSYLLDCEKVYHATPKSKMVTLPTDWERFLAGTARVGTTWKEIYVQDTLNAYSPVDGIENTKYLTCIYNGPEQLQFNMTINEIKMPYIATPATPYYNYFVNETTYDYVYNSDESVQFIWRDKLLPKIVNLIFEKMGISIEDQSALQISQIKKSDDKR